MTEQHTEWKPIGLRYVPRVGKKCRLETIYNKTGGYWICSVKGHFSSSGDTEEQAISNACRVL